MAITQPGHRLRELARVNPPKGIESVTRDIAVEFRQGRLGDGAVPKWQAWRRRGAVSST